MARRKPGTPRRGRSFSLGGLVAVLLLIGAVFLLERYELLPHGTLDVLIGREAPPERGRTAGRPPAAPTPEGRVEPAIDYAHVRAELDGIRVEPEMNRGYRREDWPHWLSPGGGCLNTREEVLIRDSAEPAVLSADRCSVLSGVWHDPYTGETFTDPRQLDIDHRVPLEEAYGSGGYDWPREKRAAYANDLTDPLTLLAASAAANRAKGSKGPEDWLPPWPDALCPYVVDWIAVKARWRLSMDERERVTVGNILSACEGPTAARTPLIGERQGP